MYNTRSVEITVGVFILIGMAALFMLAMKVSNLSSFSDNDGYEVNARFENVGGLKVRSAVTMAGVRVGRVSKISFDQQTYEALVTMTISPQYNAIPKDSSAAIFTAGLLGEQYVSLEAGGDEKYLKQGDELKLTQYFFLR